MIIDLMKKNDIIGVKQCIEDILGTLYSPEELLSKGTSIYEPWMKECISHTELPYRIIGKDLGILYEDGWEYSELYRLDTYRFPIEYKIDARGISSKNGPIYTQPVIPIAILIIDNGRYESFYKYLNLNTNSTFVSIPRDLHLSPMKRVEFWDFINLFVKYNLEDPVKIKKEEFKS